MNENDLMSGSKIELLHEDDPEHESIGLVLSYYADGGGTIFAQAVARENGMPEDAGRLTSQLTLEDADRLRSWLDRIPRAVPAAEIPMFEGARDALSALTIRPGVSS